MQSNRNSFIIDRGVERICNWGIHFFRWNIGAKRYSVRMVNITCEMANIPCEKFEHFRQDAKNSVREKSGGCTLHMWECTPSPLSTPLPCLSRQLFAHCCRDDVCKLSIVIVVPDVEEIWDSLLWPSVRQSVRQSGRQSDGVRDGFS